LGRAGERPEGTYGRHYKERDLDIGHRERIVGVNTMLRLRAEYFPKAARPSPRRGERKGREVKGGGGKQSC